MAKTIVGMFDSLADAHSAVRELVDIGVSRNDISLVAGDTRGEYTTKTGTLSDEMSGAATGAGTGAVLGGLGGLLVGLGALAIPGVGPLIAAGPLATTLLGAGVGAAAGSLLGVLVDVGVPEDEANYYAEGVRRGGILVSVRAEDEMMTDRAINILERHNAVDVQRRASEWQKTGWTRFDPSAEPYKSDVQQRLSNAPTTPLTGSSPTSEAIEFDAYASDFRSDFTNKYSSRGHTYDRYEPAYRYGYTLANDKRYAGKDWASFESDVRRDWERNNQDSTWEDFKESVRYGWERVKGYSPAEAAARADTPNSSANTFDTYASDFRTNFTTKYGNRGHTYDRYEPAYRYGYTLANEKRYTGKDWSAIESDARRDWERNYQGSAWEDFKESIRYGWERVKGYSTSEAAARSSHRAA